MLSRRDFLRLSAAGVLAGSTSGWFQALAETTAKDPKRRRSCILLWMAGGPSQMDTFDLKAGNGNGGPFKPIKTSAPGLEICEHLPKLAKFGDRLAVIRSMSTTEGDHARGSLLMRTGTLRQDGVQYPSIGSLLAKELSLPDDMLPSYISIGANRQFIGGALGPGFLGPAYTPLVVGENAVVQQGGDPAQFLKVRNVLPAPEVPAKQVQSRIDLLQDLQKDFLADRPDLPARSHQSAYERAVRLMRSEAAKAFNVEEEKTSVRDAYGRTLFGQGCLLARRLVEVGVPFIEVALSGWDTHAENFNQVKNLCGILDPAWAALMGDLKERGLLDTTTIVWMGEFGRTPRINQQNGRDHYPVAWSTVLAGGGIKGGQAVGKTSPDGTTVEERKVSVIDFLATLCLALGLDPMKQNMSNIGRPIRLVDREAKPIEEIVDKK